MPPCDFAGLAARGPSPSAVRLRLLPALACLCLAIIALASPLASPLAAAPVKAGRRLALCVGVDSFDGRWAPLSCCRRDAEKIAASLLSKCDFDEATVLTDMSDKKPTARNVREALLALVKRASAKTDLLVVFIASHGVVLEISGPAGGPPRTFSFVCPRDADITGVSYATGLSPSLLNIEADLIEVLGRSPGSSLLLVDACRDVRKVGGRARSLSEAKVAASDRVLSIFSCGRGQVAYEVPETLKHGLFAYHVLEAINSEKVRNDRGQLDVATLWGHLGRAVPEASLRLKTPTIQTPTAVFPAFEGPAPVLVWGRATSLASAGKTIELKRDKGMPSPGPAVVKAEATIRAALSRLEQSLVEAKSGGTPTHDDLAELRSQVALLEAILDKEAKDLIPGSITAGRRRLRELRSEISALAYP